MRRVPENRVLAMEGYAVRREAFDEGEAGIFAVPLGHPIGAHSKQAVTRRRTSCVTCFWKYRSRATTPEQKLARS